MAEFHKDKFDMFLGVVRKYMQMRGVGSQKDLAAITEIGISTMSRFLSQKTTDLSPQLIAKITARLNIPLHEIIDFVEEQYADKFVRLVKFYKEEEALKSGEGVTEMLGEGATKENIGTPKETGHTGPEDVLDAFSETLGPGKRDQPQKETRAEMRSASGQRMSMPFGIEGDKKELTIREKLERLTPRQRAYMADFLNLDVDGRDLIVDLGNSLFHYFRQKGVTF